MNGSTTTERPTRAETTGETGACPHALAGGGVETLSAHSTNPLHRLVADLRAERRRGRPPPGELRFSLSRSSRLARDPLGVLMPLYERYGPLFSIRVLHAVEVFMIGPEANHLITVTGRENFSWRQGSMRELIPLVGDGLLTTDGPHHDRAREILMPAFCGEGILEATAKIRPEAEASLDRLEPGKAVDINEWARGTAIRIAMHALLGLDPDDRGVGAAATRHFERALRYYGSDFHLRMLRGPGSPWRRTLKARRELDRIIYGEISRRRSGDGGRADILALLAGARSEAGERLAPKEVRDQVMTLLFAGHDTMTSTLSFLFYELARNPDRIDEVRSEIGEGSGWAMGSPALERCIDETLRLYPPAWVGPRRALEDFEFAGQVVPAGSSVNYCSLLSHRLPEVFEQPAVFNPDRFLPANRAALPPASYVPFGAGPRICIGKRFALIEAGIIAAAMLQRFTPELVDDRPLELHPMPTLGPRDGLRLRLRPAPG